MPTGQITKLSQAMRAGARKTYQIKQDFINRQKVDGKVGACALGAAAIAMGLDAKDKLTDTQLAVYDKINGQLDDVLKKRVRLPESPDYYSGLNTSIETAVITLNDDAGWSVKEIASWLEGLGY